MKASKVLFALGVVSAVGVMGLWWLGAVMHVEPPGDVGREVFGNIPSGLQAAFYVSIAAFLWLAFYLFSLRARNWSRGDSEKRLGEWKRRVRNLAEGLRMKTLLEDTAAGLMHSMIYFGLIIVTVSWVTTASSNTVESNTRLTRPDNTPDWSTTFLTASKIRSGASLRRSLARHKVNTVG